MGRNGLYHLIDVFGRLGFLCDRIRWQILLSRFQ